MFTVYLLFVLGFALLIKGADWLIRGAVAIAKRFRISEIAIGLTVVAFGTSAPELVVNIISSIRASGELVVGNIIGSNVANIALVLGVSGAIAPLAIKKSLVRKEIPFGILGILAIYFLATKNGDILTIGKTGGGILLAGFVVFLWIIYRSTQQGEDLIEIPGEEMAKETGLKMSGVLTVGGLIALGLGGELVVDSAMRIAENFDVSEKLIGLTLVAIGTSLPELVTSVMAVLRSKMDIAIGNVVGSNIFNIFWVLGVSALVSPIEFPAGIVVDLAVLGGITLLLLVATFSGEKYKLDRWEAAILLTSYVSYIGFIVWRG